MKLLFLRRSFWLKLSVLCVLPMCLLVLGCDNDDDDDDDGDLSEGPPVEEPAAPAPQEPSTLMARSQVLFGELPSQMPGALSDTPARVALGERLYFEQGISINKDQSCNTCHPIDRNAAGADNRITSPGSKNDFGPRNSPTTLNAGFHFRQFWDGRAADLKEQAGGPILNPIEMGMPDEQDVLERLRALEGYPDAFAAAFPKDDPAINYDNVGEAIAAFERTLITRNRFDQYLAGEESALSNAQKEGLTLFIDAGCVQCHNGPVLGGQFYQKVGIFGDYPYPEEFDPATGTVEETTIDYGRSEVTGDPADQYFFKVPSLREVVLTSPYYHNGRVRTLGEAVDLMSRLQLNKTLNRDEVHALLRFLVSLSDIERTTATPPPEAVQKIGWWQPPNMDEMPDGDIRYGYELLTRTASLIGPAAEDEEMRYAGNNLTCSNCHQEAGAKPFGLTWLGVANRYPQYRNRAAAMASLEDRINGCMQRSMNGEPLPVDSEEMQAIVAFFNWMTPEDTPEELHGVGRITLRNPSRRADLAGGAENYRIYCQGCHGTPDWPEHAGYSAPWEPEGAMTVPPLWENTDVKPFNNGAGMHRLLTSAEFMKTNMPLGTVWDDPFLSDEQAYDVAGYYLFFGEDVRPKMDPEFLKTDYPDLTTKPVDSPYPPYADDFPQAQHQLGPYQPIAAFYESLNQ